MKTLSELSMSPPRFIDDQHLIVLVTYGKDTPRAELREHLSPDGMFLIEEKRMFPHETSMSKRPIATQWHWVDQQEPPLYLTGMARIPSREEFLRGDGKLRLRVIVDSAGAGKSVASRQAQYLLHQTDRRHLAIRVTFSDLPQNVDAYAGPPGLPGESELVKWFRKTPETKDVPPEKAHRLIMDRVERGLCTLIVDGFDQTNASDNPDKQASSLQNYLANNPKIRCLCTGRPDAIRNRFWDSLFEKGDWHFAQLSKWRWNQICRFLGGNRFRILELTDTEYLQLAPRSLEALRKIPLSKMRQIRSSSQIYWKMVTHGLELAFNKHENCPIGFEVSDALALLALLAQECNRQGYLDGVSASEVDQFINVAWSRRAVILNSRFDIHTKTAFASKIAELLRLNVELKLGFVKDHGIVAILFSNRTMQDFFSAIWMCTEADDQDRAWLREFAGEVLTHVSRMPNERVHRAVAMKESAFVNVMDPVYRRTSMSSGNWSSRADLTHIYDSWQTMLDLAGFETKTDGSINIKRSPSSAEGTQIVSAENLVARTLGEYPNILAGRETFDSAIQESIKYRLFQKLPVLEPSRVKSILWTFAFVVFLLPPTVGFMGLWFRRGTEIAEVAMVAIFWSAFFFNAPWYPDFRVKLDLFIRARKRRKEANRIESQFVVAGGASESQKFEFFVFDENAMSLIWPSTSIFDNSNIAVVNSFFKASFLASWYQGRLPTRAEAEIIMSVCDAAKFQSETIGAIAQEKMMPDRRKRLWTLEDRHGQADGRNRDVDVVCCGCVVRDC